MLCSRVVWKTLAIVGGLSGAGAWACEDEHPPIISQPIEELIVRDADENEQLTLRFDPRGVRTVAPRADLADRWIDPDDPTGAWHYREWQWWKGHPWGESCRPRFYSDVRFRAVPRSPRGVEIAYRIDGFDCQQVFIGPNTVDGNEPYWDLVTTIRNVSQHDVEEYAQFFACYTPMNDHRSFWYWDETNELVLLADRGVGHLDGYIAHPKAYFAEQGAIPHCPRGDGKIVGRWHRPVIVSHPSPAGWRSIVMIEPQYAAALAQGIEGNAMDYIIFPAPDQRTFANGATFSVHIRNVMLKSSALPAIQQLEELWRTFEQSHVAIHEKVAQLWSEFSE